MGYSKKKKKKKKGLQSSTCKFMYESIEARKPE
jgi:hypothetical protein